MCFAKHCQCIYFTGSWWWSWVLRRDEYSHFIGEEKEKLNNFEYLLSFNIHYIQEGNGTPLQYSCLENPMDGGAWKAAVCGVAEGQTWLSDFPFTFHFHALEKEMAIHSIVLALRIPGTGEPGGLPSVGLHRVGHDWSDLAAAAAVKAMVFPACMDVRVGL